MADENKIILGIAPDPKDIKNLRTSILSQLKDLSANISKDSYARMRDQIVTNVKPKLEVDVNLSKLRGLDKKISEGIKPIKLEFDTNDVSARISRIKNLIQNNLGKFELNFKYSGNRISTVATDIDKITSSFDKAGIAKDKFAANVDQKIPQVINSFKQLKDVVNGVRQDLEKLDGTRIRILGPKEREKAAKTVAKEPAFSGVKTYDIKEMKESQREIENTIKKTDELTKATNNASKGIASFSERIGLTTARFGAYIVAAGGFYKILESFGTAKTSVIEINKEINLLTQTLDGNARKASDVANSAFQIGIKYGQSGKELTKVAAELARVGRGFGGGVGGFSNSLELFAQSKLSVGFGDIGQTIEGTKNILSQFNRTGRDTAEVLDMIASLSKKFDINAEELFTTVESGGAVFAQAGGNIKQFAAVVTTIRQLTGLPATTVGNAINSITSRLQQPELRTFVDKLTNGGTRNADGSLKGIYDQILAIGHALKGLDNQTTTSIVAKIAGVRQGKVLQPLLRDIADGKEGLNELANVEKTINNSAGQLGRNAAIGVKSFEAQIESVSAKFEEVFKNIAENKGIAHLVDEFASLAKAAASFVDILGPIIPTLVRLGTIKLGLSLVQGIPGFLRGFHQGENTGGTSKHYIKRSGGLGVYLPGGVSLPEETAGLLSPEVLSNGQTVPNNGLDLFHKRLESERKIAQYQELLQQNSNARNVYANQLRGATERHRNLQDYVLQANTVALNRALTPAQAQRIARRRLLQDAALSPVANGVSSPIPNSISGYTSGGTPIIADEGLVQITSPSKGTFSPSINKEVLNKNSPITYENFDELSKLGKIAPYGKQNKFGVEPEEEMQALLKGQKPIYYDDFNRGFKLYDQLSDEDRKKISFKEHLDKDSVAFYLSNSGQEKNVDKLFSLFNKNKFTAKDHLEIGKLLGYSNADIAAFLNRPELHNKEEVFKSLGLSPSKGTHIASHGSNRQATIPLEPIQLQNSIKARARELYNQSKGNSVNPSIAAKYILPFLSESDQNKALGEGATTGNLNRAIQNTASARALAKGARYQAEQEFAKKNPNALAGLEQETQKVIDKSLVEAKKTLYRILTSENLTQEKLDKAAKDYALTLNKATVLEKTLNQEREMLKRAIAEEESSIFAGITQQAYNKEKGTFGYRVKSLLVGNSDEDQNVKIGNRTLKKNILGRGASALDHGLKAIGPDLLMFGGAFALDALSQHADNSISSITDDNGNLAKNYQNILAQNRGAIQTSSIARGASGGLLFGGSIGGIFGPVGTAIGAGIGAIGGGIYGNATNDAQDQITKQLLVAASQSQSAQQAGAILNNINNRQSSSGTGIKSLYGSAVQITADSLTPLLSGDEDAAVGFRRNLKTAEGRAFLQRFKEQGLEIASRLTGEGQNANPGDVIQELRKAYGNTKQSVYQVGESFEELEGANKEFTKTIEEVTTKMQQFRSNPQGQASIINFAAGFRRNSELIGNQSAIRDIGTQLFLNQTSSFGGRGTPFQVAGGLANVLAERFESGTRNLDLSQHVGTQVDRLTGSIGNGYLSGAERGVLGDVAILRASVRPLAERINRLTAGQDLNNEATIAILKNQLPLEIEKFFKGNVIGSLQTNEGRVEAESIQQKLATLTDNPSQLQGDPSKLIESVFSEFGSNKDILERFGKVIENINSQITQSNALYEREHTLRENSLQLQTQITSTAVRQIARRNATSLSDLSLAGQLGAFGNTLSTGVSSGNLTEALRIQDIAARRAGSPYDIDAQKNYADARLRVTKAQDEYREKLTQSSNALQVFEQALQALKVSLDRQEGGLARLGSTSIGQRYQANFQRGIYTNLTSSLFGQGGPLNGVSNLTDLLKLGPEGFQKVAQQAALITANPAFQTASQGVSSVFGNLQAPNSPLGVSFNKQINLLNTLAGAGISPGDGATFFNTLKQYQATGGKVTTVEDQQLEVLKDINKTLQIIAGNPLTSGKLNNPNSPVANIPINNSQQQQIDHFRWIPTTQTYRNPNLPTSIKSNFAEKNVEDFEGRISNMAGGGYHLTHQHRYIEEFSKELNGMLQNFRNSTGQATSVKVDANLNVTGVDFSGKDSVTIAIVTKMMQHFADQLSTSDPAEANLRAKLNASIKSLQNTKK